MFAATMIMTAVLGQNERETIVVANAIEVLKDMTQIPEKGIPPAILADAEGFIFVPGLVKLGFLVGGKHGRGIAVLRKPDGTWSNPIMIKLTGGSIGWQAGVESSDLILVVRKKRSIEEILTARKFTLGANAGLSVGPMGRDIQAGTDVQLKAEMYAYSRSRGLFAGVSIEGGAVRVDDIGNRKLYNTELAPLHLASSAVPVPVEVMNLKETLLRLSPPKRAIVQPPLPPPVGSGN